MWISRHPRSRGSKRRGGRALRWLLPLPSIVITSFALSGEDRKAKEAGATAYIAKPYSPRDLLALIRKTLPEA